MTSSKISTIPSDWVICRRRWRNVGSAGIAPPEPRGIAAKEREPSAASHEARGPSRLPCPSAHGPPGRVSGNEAVAIRKIKAYINPLPLFLKKIRLPSISILEPRIYAERGKDGTVNLAPIMERIRTNAARRESEGAGGFSLLLRNLSLSNGRIEFKDRLTSAQFSLNDLNVATRVYLSQDRFTTSIRSSHIRFSSSAYPEMSGNVKATVEYDRGRIHVNALELATTDAVIAVSGDAGLSQDSQLDLRITGRSVTCPNVHGQ
jgi:hypothetical protein